VIGRLLCLLGLHAWYHHWPDWLTEWETWRCAAPERKCRRCGLVEERYKLERPAGR
jgi:hypothetical protein